MSKFIPFLAAALMAAGAAGAEVIKVPTTKTVPEAADALEAVVTKAGAHVFARVDHGKGAMSIDQDIGASQLLIFGNPKVGTPAMQANRLAGLALPLHVLVYEDEAGKVWLSYETPADRIKAATGEMPTPEVTAPMDKALANLSRAAAN